MSFNKKFGPSLPEPPKSKREHSTLEIATGVSFVLFLSCGLLLIAINELIVQHQLVIGFSLIFIGCLPGWAYFRIRRKLGAAPTKLVQRMGDEFVIHAKDDESAPSKK